MIFISVLSLLVETYLDEFLLMSSLLHSFHLLTVRSKVRDPLFLVFTEIVGVITVVTPFYFVIVVVKGLLFDVLVLPSEHFVPHVKVNSSLLKGHWLYVTLYLEVVVALTDCPLSNDHINSLPNSSSALVFELRIK